MVGECRRTNVDWHCGEVPFLSSVHVTSVQKYWELILACVNHSIQKQMQFSQVGFVLSYKETHLRGKEKGIEDGSETKVYKQFHFLSHGSDESS